MLIYLFIFFKKILNSFIFEQILNSLIFKQIRIWTNSNLNEIEFKQIWIWTNLSLNKFESEKFEFEQIRVWTNLNLNKFEFEYIFRIWTWNSKLNRFWIEQVLIWTVFKNKIFESEHFLLNLIFQDLQKKEIEKKRKTARPYWAGPPGVLRALTRATSHRAPTRRSRYFQHGRHRFTCWFARKIKYWH
jgi:hypothetical protein